MRELLIFSDGMRSFREGIVTNTTISSTTEEPVKIIDLTNLTDEQYQQILSDPHNDQLIDSLVNAAY